LEVILDAAVSITGADKGNIQLLDPGSGALVIAAQRGFEEPFLNFFARVRDESSACGAAMLSAQSVVVEDVTRSELFAGQASLDALLAAGVRAVQSTPLLSSDGSLLGMISTHFSRPTRLEERKLRLTDLLARQAADYLERKQAEEKQRESEERLRMAQSAANIGAFDWDIVEGKAEWAPETERMWGLPMGGFGGTYEDWKKQVHPEDLPGAKDMVRRALADPDTPYSFEYRIIRPDGSVRWIYAKGATIRDESGRPVRMVGLNMDVTDRKQAEAERERLLESERRARTEAEHATRVKDEFLATVSHELRSPLTAIVGWADVIRRGNATEAQIEHGVDVIRRNALTQAQLIGDLLDLSRIVTGKMRLSPEVVDLGPVIHAVLELVKPSAEARSIEISCSIEPLRERVHGDPARLQQIVWNLLSNAVKFTPKGGRIEVTLLRANEHLEVRVSDTGKGIPAEFLPHVFERFRQADASGAREYGGLGIGLALVRELTQLHGGQISAASEGEGKGATFTVQLPVADTQRDPHPEASTPPAVIIPGAALLEGVRVLVVDDEPDALEVIQRILEDRHAQVTPLRSADAALSLLAAGASFDVVLSDIGMPGRDGYEFIAGMRKLGIRTPAAALTGLARSEDRTRALYRGFQAHVPKPAQASELLATVASLAGRIAR
jgi:PAS domain S-box-containing protein